MKFKLLFNYLIPPSIKMQETKTIYANDIWKFLEKKGLQYPLNILKTP